ncbi:hypothetical protein FRUB_01690 [Fimbriiglobus ruber]|uniref:Uncharacterized protein n=1 Tax=Fimbriiglobus ruber TaxID=1908690 RepID=A0A225E771_9BACT|nr:hypothetical protein FRUB_01690 [Fimbriiglobus ruber]
MTAPARRDVRPSCCGRLGAFFAFIALIPPFWDRRISATAVLWPPGSIFCIYCAETPVFRIDGSPQL